MNLRGMKKSAFDIGESIVYVSIPSWKAENHEEWGKLVVKSTVVPQQ